MSITQRDLNLLRAEIGDAMNSATEVADRIQGADVSDELVWLAQMVFAPFIPHAFRYAAALCPAECADALEQMLLWQANSRALHVLQGDLPLEWFAERGVRWFDTYAGASGQWCMMHPDDVREIVKLVEDQTVDPERFWEEVIEAAEADPCYPRERLALLYQIATGVSAPTTELPESPDVESAFLAWCDQQGVMPLKRLQQGMRGADTRSWVYLALDTDGIVKVFKEVVDPDPRLQIPHDEVAVHQHLEGVRGLPQCYGIVDVGSGIRFIRMSVCYGQGLSDLLQTAPLPLNQVLSIVSQLARTLQALHERGVVYLDLRPENVRYNLDTVHLLDFSASRLLEQGWVHTHLFDPAYAAPEMVLEGRATAKTDVFQLGVLFYQLRYGHHPFSRARSKGFLANLFEQGLPTVARMWVGEIPNPDSLLGRMLHEDPDERLSMAQVVECLRGTEGEPLSHPPRAALFESLEENIVLFPARMGIPHKGHIEYIARLIELGFHVRVSIQRSFTITQRDPFPKWLVLKMVARSLIKRGFVPDRDFSFLLTPYFETTPELRMYFGMMPGREQVVAVASSNPMVHALFPDLPILDQCKVFGTEGDVYTDRSWGERLRQAVRTQDRKTFDALVASGVEDILLFDELHALDTAVPVDFVSGRVYVELAYACEVLGRIRWRRYQTPEAMLHRVLGLTLVDPYERDSHVIWEDRPMLLCYRSMRMEGEDQVLQYELIPADPA